MAPCIGWSPTFVSVNRPASGRGAIGETVRVEAIVGRDPELEAIQNALAEAPRALTAVLIEGEAGIGKSTLWAEAVATASARGWRVLAARAVASEAQVTLSALGDLLHGIDEALLQGLPVPQARAIDAALLRSDAATPVESRVLGIAFRSVLEELSAASPVLLAIDDAHWLDAASAAVVSFALRRLDAAPVLLLLARRSPIALPFDLREIVPSDRLTTVRPGPITVAGLHVLLAARRGAAPSRPTLIRIHQASGGNPLFALEIARALEATGEPPAGEPLPVPPDVRELLQARLGAMPVSARQLLLDLAVAGGSDADRLAGIEGRDLHADLARAESDGLVRREAGFIDFSHPLYAAAALAGASPSERRAAHARVATSAASLEERARHRALAAEGTDEELARDLDAAAQTASRRAAPLAAAELLRLAIERTPAGDGDQLASRRLALGEALKRAGDTLGAISELETVAASDIPRVRARARLVLAGIRYETEASTVLAVELGRAALTDAGGDPALEAHAYAVLAAVDWEDLRNHHRYVEEGLRRLAEVPTPDPLVEGLLLLGRCGSDFSAGRPLDPAIVARALELERVAPAPTVADRFSASLGTWLKWSDRFDEARIWLERTRQTAIDEGDEGSLPYALAHLPELEVWTGNWDRAEAVAREHLALAESLDLDSQRDQALYNLALVHVHQGRIEEARAEIAEAIALTEASHDDYLLSGVLPSLGLLELSLGQAPAAVVALERAFAIRTALGPTSTWRPGPDLIEALVAVGSLDRARDIRTALEARLTGEARVGYRANMQRAAALLLAASGQLAEARDLLEAALDLHDQATIPFDRARTLLALGQVRRRLRERGAARDAFEAARRAFDQLGARIWAERAAAELQRTGLRRGSGRGLTETERRVAELAASGMTNREVAAALFMSPKTVDANLGRAYAKLGIRSRAELGAVIGPGPRATGRTNMGDHPM